MTSAEAKSRLHPNRMKVISKYMSFGAPIISLACGISVVMVCIIYDCCGTFHAKTEWISSVYYTIPFTQKVTTVFPTCIINSQSVPETVVAFWIAISTIFLILACILYIRVISIEKPPHNALELNESKMILITSFSLSIERFVSPLPHPFISWKHIYS